jgi:hypothetical protein
MAYGEPTELSGVAWFGIVTAASALGVVVAPPEPVVPEESVEVPLLPVVSVGGGVALPSAGVVVPAPVPSSGTVGVPPLVSPDAEGLLCAGLRMVAAVAAVPLAENAAPPPVEVVAPPLDALPPWCPCGDTWWPWISTLGAGVRAAVVAAGGVEAEAGCGSFLPAFTTRTTASVTTAPVTKQRRLRRITTFFATIVTPQR